MSVPYPEHERGYVMLILSCGHYLCIAKGHRPGAFQEAESAQRAINEGGYEFTGMLLDGAHPSGAGDGHGHARRIRSEEVAGLALYAGDPPLLVTAFPLTGRPDLTPLTEEQHDRLLEQQAEARGE